MTHGSAQRGFTLIELMIVVAIISVLAVVAGTAYRKYADKARSSEVFAMFGEIRAKEEGYRAENGVYCSTSATAATACNSGNEDTVFPALLSSGEPKAKPITGAAWGWGPSTGLGINPGKSQLYCGYVAVAGGPNSTDWGNAGTRGQALFNGTQPTTQWFYMSAICDNDGNTSVNVNYNSSVNGTAVVINNEGR